jgi:hypothetical protein
VRAGRRGLQPGEQAGERGFAQPQLHRVAVGQLAFHNDAASAQRGGFRGVGRAARDHRQVTSAERLVRALRDAEGVIPAEFVQLVGSHAQAPRACPPAQRAFDRAAAALEQEPASGQKRRGRDEDHQERAEQPGHIERQRRSMQ